MTLLMRDQENIEKGIEQGIKQGIEQGISGLVSVLNGLNIPDDIIKIKIQEEFKCSEEDAERYIRKKNRE